MKKTSVSSKQTSHRQKRVANLINSAIIDCFKRERGLDVKLSGCPITITKVEVSADLKVAHCYFLPFNTELTIKDIELALKNSKYAIRSYVTDKIQLKYSPEIRYHYDHGTQNYNLVEELLKKVITPS